MENVSMSFIYPNEEILPFLYKFIYKYERLNIKNKNDSQVIATINSEMSNEFIKTMRTLRMTCIQKSKRDNNAILQLYNEYRSNLLEPEERFLFEKRTESSTFINSLMYHIRNIIAHANYTGTGNLYELYDKTPSNRLTSFGFISKENLLNLITSFVA